MSVDERLTVATGSLKLPLVASVPGPVTGTEYHRVLYGHMPDWRVTDLRIGAAPVVGADIHHWHWPETIPGFTRRARRLAGHAWMRACRMVGPRSRWVWTVHNLDPHTEVRDWDRWVTDRWLPQVAAVVFLSQRSANEAIGRWPQIAQLPRLVTRHQAYDDFGFADAPRQAARRALGLPDDRTLVGVAGRLRADKGVAGLIDAWSREAPDSATLVVWGRLDPDTRRVLGRLRPTSSVIVRETDLSDTDLRRVLRALDATVLPYQSGTNSGMALLSLSVGTPVLGLRGVWSEALAVDLDIRTLAIFEDLEQLVGFATSGHPLQMRVHLPAAYAPKQVSAEHSQFFDSLIGRADPLAPQSRGRRSTQSRGAAC